MDALSRAVREATVAWLPRGATVLSACSGGADSVALTAALCEAGIAVTVGHVDHGLRPESAADAALVRTVAERLGRPCLVERCPPFDVRQRGLEAAAREARHAALVRIARTSGATVVATGHTMRDRAETVLLRLLRGAGPAALAAVRPRRMLARGITLVRPLLGVAREETEAFCQSRGLPFVLDPHNVDPRRARARLRALWPALRELNPRLDEALAGTAEIFAEEDALLQAVAVDELRESGLRVAKLRELHPAILRRALLHAANAAGLRPERIHLEALRTLLAKGAGALDVPGGRIRVESGRLRLETGTMATIPRSVVLAIPSAGRYRWGIRTLVVTSGPPGIPVDLSRAPFPWRVRARAPGDRFRPAGGRMRKVADLLADAKVPRDERDALALLEDAHGRLFWVEGVRPGEASESRNGSMAFITVHPEMDASAGTLDSLERDGLRSATMLEAHDEEPR